MPFCDPPIRHVVRHVVRHELRAGSSRNYSPIVQVYIVHRSCMCRAGDCVVVGDFPNICLVKKGRDTIIKRIPTRPVRCAEHFRTAFCDGRDARCRWAPGAERG